MFTFYFIPNQTKENKFNLSLFYIYQTRMKYINIFSVTLVNDVILTFPSSSFFAKQAKV